MRLIDLDKLQEELYSMRKECRASLCGDGEKHMEALDWVIDKIEKIDTVEVVRCKNCKYSYINSFSDMTSSALCRKWTNKADEVQMIMGENDYCSWGEKKDVIE